MRWEGAYPPEDGSATAARADVRRALEGSRVPTGVVDDVLIALGELVANAIRHAATELTVAVGFDGDRLRIEVSDGDTRPPAMLAADPDATSGRGLVIVAGVADRWGFETSDRDGITGKTVWAEFDVAGEGG